MNVAKFLPPPLIDPVKHPIASWVANKAGFTITQAVAAAIAFPVAQSAFTNEDGPDKPTQWRDLAIAGVTGAVLGALTGCFFPTASNKQVDRWGQVRGGALSGAWGGPISGTALAFAGKWLGWFKQHGPFDWDARKGQDLLQPTRDSVVSAPLKPNPDRN